MCSIFYTATCFGCPYQPSSDRTMVRIKSKKGKESPYKLYSRVSFYVLEYLVVNRIVVKRVIFTRVVPKVMSKFFFACKLGTADEGECGGRWNQLLCYSWVSCEASSLHHVTSITPNKMADNDMSFRQRAVIEFLVKEEIPAAEIHQRHQRAYGSVCMGASSVRRWMKHFKDGKT